MDRSKKATEGEAPAAARPASAAGGNAASTTGKTPPTAAAPETGLDLEIEEIESSHRMKEGFTGQER